MRIPASSGRGKSTDHRVTDVLKRLFDIVAASLVLLVIAPLVLLPVAIIIVLESRGPAIFAQPRYGVGGRVFRMYKFRTMIQDSTNFLAENPQLKRELEQNYKISNDPRITRSGHTLRRLAIDELPQLLNVLKGEMSIVGPRPIPVYPSWLDEYGDRKDLLLSVRPGITGLWQVSGKNSLPMEEHVRLDLRYVTHRSIWMDTKIICKTVPVVAGLACDITPPSATPSVILVRAQAEREHEEARAQSELTVRG